MAEYIVRIVKIVSTGALWYRKRVEADNPEEALAKVEENLDEYEKVEGILEHNQVDIEY